MEDYYNDEDEFGAVGVAIAIAVTAAQSAIIVGAVKGAKAVRLRSLAKRAKAGNKKAQLRLKRLVSSNRFKRRIARKQKRINRLANRGNKIAQRRLARFRKQMSLLKGIRHAALQGKFGADEKKSSAGSALIGILAGVGFLFALPFMAKSSFDESNRIMRQNARKREGMDWSDRPLPMSSGPTIQGGMNSWGY